ncbi:septum formation protein Maf [Candidatus Marinamargulisbacteria bacterium SCGC AG-414-C22]|nr:septum formation protein Maf [Candidatus Marinamargulisbacteria bacterium SCGC AG-414-C22]
MSEVIYLASQSPRRVELLSKLPVTFTQIPNLLNDETLVAADGNISNQIIQLCIRKAKASLANYKNWILTADTCVILNDTVFGKPRSEKEAEQMLLALSGETHDVISACCLYNPQTHHYFTCSDTAHVTFSNLSLQCIQHYIKNCTPFDKAGSYGIQDIPSHFLAQLNGNYETVLGLPINQLKKLLKHVYT